MGATVFYLLMLQKYVNWKEKNFEIKTTSFFKKYFKGFHS